MKIVFVSASDPVSVAGSPSDSLDRVIIRSLSSICEVDVVTVRSGEDAASRLANGVGSGDLVITSGWRALAKCEEFQIVPRAHIVGDEELPEDRRVGLWTWLGGSRRSSRCRGADELINRPDSVLVRTVGHVRWLRSRGRFPRLIVDGLSLDAVPSSPSVSVITVDQFVNELMASSPSSAVEEPLVEALGAATVCVLPDMTSLLEACLDRQGPRRIQTVNLQHLYLARVSPVFRRTVATADAITADGWPVVRLFQSAGLSVERATGADLVPAILSDPRINGLRIAILGGAADPGAIYSSEVQRVGGSVVFREHGDKRDWDPQVLARKLNDVRADLVLIAVTQPIGDLLARDLVGSGYLGTAIGIGAAIELYVGGERRAAAWIQKMRMEWLFRFAQDPKRLWRRYCVEGVPTYLRVIWPMTRGRALGQGDIETTTVH